MSSSCPAATISTVRATSAAEGVGSPEGWLWTATRAVACWRTVAKDFGHPHLRLDAVVNWGPEVGG